MKFSESFLPQYLSESWKDQFAANLSHLGPARASIEIPAHTDTVTQHLDMRTLCNEKIKSYKIRYINKYKSHWKTVYSLTPRYQNKINDTTLAYHQRREMSESLSKFQYDSTLDCNIVKLHIHECICKYLYNISVMFSINLKVLSLLRQCWFATGSAVLNLITWTNNNGSCCNLYLFLVV